MLNESFLDGVTADGGPGREDERERDERARRLAATLAGRMAGRHACAPVSCRHRNHHRDARYRAKMLEALDLPDEGAKPADYAESLAWHSVTRGDALATLGRQ